jgi:cell pole-organizing protein PopZ
MEASELESARALSFKQLDDQKKANVTEKFADAIQRETGVRDAAPLPTLLDEVFRQDFIRESTQAPPPDEEEAADLVRDLPPLESETSKHKTPGFFAGASLSKAETKLGPSRPAGFSHNDDGPSQEKKKPAMPPVSEQPPVQAQFVGATQSSMPAPVRGTLEDAVREMLRPLLVQWLNEHMPRILENAIREEITTRGLLPKSDV